MAETSENSGNNMDNPAEKLGKENRALKELLAEALEKIKNLEKRLENYEKPNDGYNKGWTVITKIVFLIAKADKPLRSSEIIPLIQTREPSIVNKQMSLEKYLSAFLYTAVKNGRITTYKLKGTRGKFYCLPEWISEMGELVPEMRWKIY